MADDPLSKFTSKLRAKTESPSTARPPLPPTIVHHAADGRQAYEAYEAMDNNVRTTDVEVRCAATGLSYFFDYAIIAVPILEFRTEERLFFTGGGYAVTIKGRNLRGVVRAMRLKSCTTIQDYDSNVHVLPEPIDHSAPFVERIDVEVLRPGKPEARSSERSEND